MGLHALLEAIRASGEEQVQEIREQARQEVEEILAKARPQAEDIRERACLSEMEPAIKERARVIHRARLEALRAIGEVRESLVDAALEQTHGRLSGIRGDAVYPQVLRMLLQESLEELESERGQPAVLGSGRATQVRLEADPRDRSTLESLLSDVGLALPVSYSLDTWGGLVAKSEDGRVVVINTLESRLERATPYLRRYLAALFENEVLERVENPWVTALAKL
jgi:V/A-type H+-transporting ATPase subunit E